MSPTRLAIATGRLEILGQSAVPIEPSRVVRRPAPRQQLKADASAARLPISMSTCRMWRELWQVVPL